MRFTSSQPIGRSLPHSEVTTLRPAATALLHLEFLFRFLFFLELEFLFFVRVGEENGFFVLLRLGGLGGLFGVVLLLARLGLVLARAHLRRLRFAADVAVLARVLEQRALQHLAAAIETRHDRA